ncbi:MAG: SufE family protein [Crocinitomicaceae bacterium]|nr:SufE family protein [Crocinitomicaceae bacterium]
MGIEEKQQEVIDEFGVFSDWMQKYEYIIELGKELPLIDEKYKTDDHLIRGCQSRVWLNAAMDESGVILFTADSDAIITKGLIALVIRVLSGEKPTDIVGADLHFVKDIGLQEHLSPTRSNGLASMIKQMKIYALAMGRLPA